MYELKTTTMTNRPLDRQTDRKKITKEEVNEPIEP